MKIMAPAGDRERLEAAIKAGADEVYMGVAGFGARRFAKNFSVDEYVAAIDLAHRSNVSVHLTFNTILSDAELNLVYPDLKRLYEAGLDEVIVQDFGVASWLRESFPELPLCASTQLSPGNAIELNWFEKQGFKRAVLARELSLDEIRSIRKQTTIELEVFASGALCLGCSGKCYLSSFIGGRSGNRGMCAQPCRQYYKARRVSANGEESPNAEYGYFLSLKDQLQGSAEIAELMKIGVDSIKIEGRMKSPVYVYEVVRYYRDLVDQIAGVPREISEKRLSIKRSSDAAPKAFDEEARRFDVASVFNRGYDRGYYYDHDPNIVNEFYSSNFGVEVGRVRRDAVRLSQPLRNGDGVVFLDDTARKLGGLNVSGITLVDPTNPRRSRVVESAEPNDLVRFDDPIPEGAVTLYRTFNYRLNKEAENALQQTRRREPIDASLIAKVGRPLQLTLKNERVSATVAASQPVEKAQKKGVDAASLLASLDRFGETPFYLGSFKPTFDPDAFAPKSLLNQLRQEAVDALEKKTVESYRRVAAERPELVGEIKPKRVWSSDLEESIDPTPYLAAVVRTRAQYDACQKFGVPKIYAETRPVQFESRLRLQTPPEFAPSAGTVAQAVVLEDKGEPFALDWFFNVGNARAVRYLSDRFPHADSICLSPEISDRAVAAIVTNVDQVVKDRGVKLALPVYGRLLAMFTQKTLFDAPTVKITNADDREILVEKNADRFDASDDGSEPVTGSSLYLREPLDLIDAIPWILKSGVQELRLEFTTERFAQVDEILRRVKNVSSSGRYSTYSYGFTRDGVF
ncbi:MAG: U32 family peptidase [Thermoguttaceae bacterium]|nr:U32 family peptidase [Thermoguttaceae bacterium]